MRKVHILAVGKPQEPWQAQAIHSYLTRLAPFARVEVVEVAEGHEGSAKPDTAKTRKREAEALLKALPRDATVIVLDERGKNLDVPGFLEKQKQWTEGGRAVAFVIGGSWGLDASVTGRADAILSFGKQTLPHILARIVLLEQLYRAETLERGKTYHK